MNLPRIRLIAVLSLLVTSYSFAQTTNEENWYKETGRGDNWYTKFDFKRYTKDDVRRASSKYLRIVGREDLNEWEGHYRLPLMLGEAELIWSSKDGFVEAYTYHTLAGLNFGRTVNHHEKVQFHSEKPTASKLIGRELIKVKFGDTHFLIAQIYLRNFAERAAGLTSVPEENEYYWIKTSDEDKKVFGLPVYPKRFQYLIRQPIRTKILSIGKPRLRQDKFENGEVYAEYHERLIGFDAGLDKGVKVDMSVFAEDFDEWIRIVRVSKNRSFGILSRSLSKAKKEVCWVEDSVRERERPCVSVRIGVFARTLSQEFKFE